MISQAICYCIVFAHSTTVAQYVGSAGTLLLRSAAMATIRLRKGGRWHESQCDCENTKMLNHEIFQSLLRISIRIIRESCLLFRQGPICGNNVAAASESGLAQAS
jgi:hypothetical protein